jgi:hypothetical protein
MVVLLVESVRSHQPDAVAPDALPDGEQRLAGLDVDAFGADYYSVMDELLMDSSL